MKKQKENFHENITWSEMAKQNVQAKKVRNLLWRMLHHLLFFVPKEDKCKKHSLVEEGEVAGVEWYLQGEESKRLHVVERKVLFTAERQALFAVAPKAVFAVFCEGEATSKPHRTITSNNPDLIRTAGGEAEDEGHPGLGLGLGGYNSNQAWNQGLSFSNVQNQPYANSAFGGNEGSFQWDYDSFAGR